MLHRIKTFAALFLCLFLLTFAVNAAAVDAPDKASLLAAWEQEQRSNPDVTLFEKTAEDGVYNFATTLFPYNGRLKVTNVVVDKNPASYSGEYSYEARQKGVKIHGVVEVSLLDQDNKCVGGCGCGRTSYGQSSWERGNDFYYDEKTNEWFPQYEFEKRFAQSDFEKLFAKPVDYDDDERSDSMITNDNQLSKIVFDIVPLVFFIGFLILVMLWARGRNNKYMTMNETIMARQKEAVERQAEGLVLEREQNQLLRDILQTLQNKGTEH